MTLESYHQHLLFNMYSKKIIGHRYKSIEKIARICKWQDIVAEHGGGRIKTVIRQLSRLGLVNLHGKGKVASLTQNGVLYVRGEFNV